MNTMNLPRAYARACVCACAWVCAREFVCVCVGGYRACELYDYDRGCELKFFNWPLANLVQ